MLKLIRHNVFNFQSFWFMIILMLFIEWFIRKKKGDRVKDQIVSQDHQFKETVQETFNLSESIS